MPQCAAFAPVACFLTLSGHWLTVCGFGAHSLALQVHAHGVPAVGESFFWVSSSPFGDSGDLVCPTLDDLLALDRVGWERFGFRHAGAFTLMRCARPTISSMSMQSLVDKLTWVP